MTTIFRHLVFGSLISFTVSLSALAYMPFVPNANLKEEVESQPFRLLPRGENYTFAIDGDFFKPVFIGNDNYNYYKYDFYHGNGYWVDIRSEFRARDHLRLNFKIDVVHGTSSNGPSFLALMIPHVGLTYIEKNFLGFSWEGRLGDINRQTIGTGLFIEMKETEGGYAIAQSDFLDAKVMVDGTGSFRLDGGVIASEVKLWKGWLGGTVLIQENDTEFRAPEVTWTAFSMRDLGGGLGYGIEGGGNRAAYAGLAFVQLQQDFNQLHVWVKPQARYYGKGLLGSLPRNISHNYVSYDQNDKPFTNLMDIFAYGDNVVTTSAELKSEFDLSPFWSVFSENEVINYQFRDRKPVRAVLFRAGIKMKPMRDRDDELVLHIGNKFYIASTSQVDQSQLVRDYSRPNLPDFENRPLFLQQMYWMVNYMFRM